MHPELCDLNIIEWFDWEIGQSLPPYLSGLQVELTTGKLRRVAHYREKKSNKLPSKNPCLGGMALRRCGAWRALLCQWRLATRWGAVGGVSIGEVLPPARLPQYAASPITQAESRGATL